MDKYFEKMVAKKKTVKDFLIIALLIIAAAVLSFFIMLVIPQYGIFLVVGAAYGAYYLIAARNIEYEYIVTTDELDIDAIINRKKRKRIFSASCKNFDILAKVKSEKHGTNASNIENKIYAVTSMDEEDIYFATLSYDKKRTIVYFQPSEKMLENFRKYIPRRIFI